MKKTIHFAHANGFPARVYSKLFAALEPEFNVNFLEKHAHNPQYPVTKKWQNLRDELSEEIERRYDAPIIGIGHSLGGILHFLAAVEKPELYRHIILLDAPLVSPLSGLAWRLFTLFRGTDNLPLVRATVRRRDSWKSKAEALEHFQSKEVFQRFDADILRDYIEYGIVPDGDGFKLFFEPRVEAEIYRTLPLDFSRFRRRLKVPADYIGGADSREARLARLSYMKKTFRSPFIFCPARICFRSKIPSKRLKLSNELFDKIFLMPPL